MTVSQCLPAILGLALSCVAVTARADGAAPAHETLRIQSAALTEARRINVYLPPEYDQRRDVVYPVLYMPDGGEQEDFPHLARAVDDLIRAGQIRPMLVVGIENTQRRRDMTGPTEVESDRKIAPQVGGSAAFRTFISNELIPVIHARYRVSDEDAIIGESLAGLFVVETLFLRPQTFDTYIALDPSLWWNNQQWVRQAQERLQTMTGERPRLYVATGEPGQTNAREVGAFAQELQTHAGAVLRWDFASRPDLRHDTIYRGLERELLVQLFPLAASMPSGAAPMRP